MSRKIVENKFTNIFLPTLQNHKDTNCHVTRVCKEIDHVHPDRQTGRLTQPRGC